MRREKFDAEHMITLECSGFGTRIVQDKRDGTIFVDDGTGLSPYNDIDVPERVRP